MTQTICRLILMPPPVDISQNGWEKLTQALKNTNVAAIFIAPQTPGFVPLGDEGGEIARENGVAIIHVGLPTPEDLHGYDGAYLGENANKAIIGSARELLGHDAMIGADAGDTRHQAMMCAESGVDFLSFGPENGENIPSIERISWWSEIFVIPSLAMGEITLQNAAPLIKAGADFIALPSSIWSASEEPRAIISAFNRLISETSAP